MTLPHIRPARPADFDAIVAIYNHYIEHTAITFDLNPYTVENRQPWFSQFPTMASAPDSPDQANAVPTGRHQLYVAELDDPQSQGGKTIAGYASSGPLRIKAAYDPSVETSVYLNSNHTGKGLGTQLYSTLLESLAKEDIHRVFGGITLPNAGSIALHVNFGFKLVGTWHQVGRKFDKFWDVAWYEKEM